MHIITLTGFKASEREALAKAIGEIKASHLPDLVHQSNATLKGRFTTILCCKSLVASYGEPKFNRAIEWGIPVVSWRWIERSLAQGCLQPMDEFKTDDTTGLELSAFLSRFLPSLDIKGKENIAVEADESFQNAHTSSDHKKAELKPLIEAKDRLNTPLAPQPRSSVSSSHIPSQLSLNQMAPDHTKGPDETYRPSDMEFSFRPHLKSQHDPKQLDFDYTTDEIAKGTDSMDISPEIAGFKSRIATPMSVAMTETRRCFSFSPLPPGLEISMTPAGDNEKKVVEAPYSVLVEHNMLIPETQCDEAISLDSPKSLISYLKTRQMQGSLVNDECRAEGKTSTRLLYSWNAAEEGDRSPLAPAETAHTPPFESRPQFSPLVIDKEDSKADWPSIAPQPAIQPQHGRLSAFVDPGLPTNTFAYTPLAAPLDDTQDNFSSPPPDSYDYHHELEFCTDPRELSRASESADEIEMTEEEEERLVQDLEDDVDDGSLVAPSVSKQTPLRRLQRGSLCPPSSISKPPELVKQEDIVKEGGGGAAARALAAARAARMAMPSSSRPEVVPIKMEDSSKSSVSNGRVVNIAKYLSRPPKLTTAKENPHVSNSQGSLKGVEFADEISINGETITCRSKAKTIKCPKIALPPACPSSYLHSTSCSQWQAYPIEPFAIYRRAGGEWWIEFHRLLSFKDALAMIQQGEQSWLPCLASDFDPTREVFKALQREHTKLSNVCEGQVTLHRTKKISQAQKIKIRHGEVFFQRFGWDLEEKKVLVEVDGSDLVID